MLVRVATLAAQFSTYSFALFFQIACHSNKLCGASIGYEVQLSIQNGTVLSGCLVHSSVEPALI